MSVNEQVNLQNPQTPCVYPRLFDTLKRTILSPSYLPTQNSNSCIDNIFQSIHRLAVLATNARLFVQTARCYPILTTDRGVLSVLLLVNNGFTVLTTFWANVFCDKKSCVDISVVAKATYTDVKEQNARKAT